jgi:hypothetical protein
VSLDLSGLPILDQHCHPLLRDGVTLGRDGLPALLQRERRGRDARRHAPTTIFFRWALKEIAAFLGCAPTVESVLATRAAVGHEALTNACFARPGSGMLLVDHGYQTATA